MGAGTAGEDRENQAKEGVRGSVYDRYDTASWLNRAKERRVGGHEDREQDKDAAGREARRALGYQPPPSPIPTTRPTPLTGFSTG
jgi:hypothetical protein